MSLLTPERPEPAPTPPPTAAATSRFDLRRFGLAVAAPALAVVVALAVASIALLVSGSNPLTVYARMLEEGTTLRSALITVNNAVPLYLSGLAVALGFRMGLFNIGVEGQYQLAALLAAAAGAAVVLPGPLHLLFVVLVAMVVGAMWAGVAAVLKTTRGVSEVISTIMLNVIAGGIAAYLLSTYLQERVEGSNNSRTPRLDESARFPNLDPVLRAFGVEPPQGTRLGGFVLVAAVVGVVYWLLVSRSRFGFDLRATGLSPSASVASGVNAKRMTIVTMLMSGAIAGLVGLPQLVGSSYAYGLDFTSGLGFTGIGVALLGRGSPVGVAIGALLFAFLERSSATLQRIDVPTEIYVIMQGSIVLSVVVAYEAVRRIGVAQAERAVRRAVDPEVAA
ncbi:MAG: inner-rane translocator [Frankiales bacterium]|nr:inner-rane translocator [Frankiales bacterium]